MEEDHNELRGMIDGMTPQQAFRIAEACNLTSAGDGRALPQARTMATRVRYLRAAFIGDVRLPFLVFIVLLAIFFSGWFVARNYYDQLVDEQVRRARAEAFADAEFQAHMLFNKLQMKENPKEFQKFLDELVFALEKARQEVEASHGDFHDQ